MYIVYKSTMCMEEDGKDKQGNCNACGITYIKERYYTGGHPSNWDYYFVECPECHYHPKFGEEISELIDRNIGAQVSSNGRIKFNSDELSRIVLKEIFKIWPKPNIEENQI